MKHFALIYEMVENFAERRKPFRQAHLQLINDAHARGLIVMAGAMGDPPDGGLLIFRADSPAAVEEALRRAHARLDFDIPVRLPVC